ncbi:hypothetical protein [Natronococcus jeotgali]|uniref:Uncharacterized protein n=1 Tax=Natronococcus jeotgali DSM 18795 TaxID=1227498 RepID=L9WQK4_9EURY|nr:hypothetical protein [Natronococcus jeotgali]ELY50603.1 hypothetical protein C492_22547 [Natronococcus jeotgali DSM 18795]
MTKDLVDKAREIGGEELAKRVEILENTINEMSSEEALNEEIQSSSIPLPDSALEVMSPEEKQEYLLSIETEGDEKANVVTESISIPTPGSGGQGEGGSIEVEYQSGPTRVDEMGIFRREMGKLREQRNEEIERANQQSRDPDPIFTGYTNSDEIEGDSDLDIPEPGSGGDDDDE